MAMNLTRPDFHVDKPKPDNPLILGSIWWFWRMVRTLTPDLELGGIYADKSGFHNSGKRNKARWPGNYSIRDKVNQFGPGWDAASAIDLTFPSAQSGNYRTIVTFFKRLWNSAHDPKDPRLDMSVFEFYGQLDNDRSVEGYNEYREEGATSDPSHLWHIHISFIRSKVGDYWAMWALYTVLAGWSVDKWRASLPAAAAPAPTKPPAGLPSFPLGKRVLELTTPHMRGTDVKYVQAFIGKSAADGEFGPDTRDAVIWYQRMRGLKADGVVGPKTWASLT